MSSSFIYKQEYIQAVKAVFEIINHSTLLSQKGKLRYIDFSVIAEIREDLKLIDAIEEEL